MPIRRAPFDNGSWIAWNVGGQEHVLPHVNIPGPEGSQRALAFVQKAIQDTLQNKRDILSLASEDPERGRTAADDTPTQFLAREGPVTLVVHRSVQVTALWAGGRYSTIMQRLG